MMLSDVLNILFDGFAFAMVLFLISVGLSVTMGLMGIANLAHGAVAMLGAYVGITVANSLHWPFALVLVASFAFAAVLGAVIERLFFTRLYKASEIDQVLLTIGLVFVSVSVTTWLWGPLLQPIELPEMLKGRLDAGFHQFPTYRVFLICFGIVIAIGLWFGLERTELGARIRAAVDNRRMAQTLGINVGRLFTLAFALGSGLAGLGGALSVEVLGLTPIYAFEHLSMFLIVVAVGGMGSTRGAFFAAVVLGVCDTAGKYLLPEIGGFFIYALTFAILMIRPQGLWGKA